MARFATLVNHYRAKGLGDAAIAAKMLCRLQSVTAVPALEDPARLPAIEAKAETKRLAQSGAVLWSGPEQVTAWTGERGHLERRVAEGWVHTVWVPHH